MLGRNRQFPRPFAGSAARNPVGGVARLCLWAIVTLLAGCQYSPDTAQRSIAYNQGIATFTNDLFLTNVLRAGERNLTIYTRNTANTTSSTISPQFGFTATRNPSSLSTQTTQNLYSGTPSGPNSATQITRGAATLTAAFMPQLGATETNQLTLSNSDDQGSTFGIMATVKISEISNYLAEGFNQEELFLLFFQSLSMPVRTWENLPAAAAVYCSEPNQSVSQYCKLINYTETQADASDGALTFNKGCFRLPRPAPASKRGAAAPDPSDTVLVNIVNDAAVPDPALKPNPTLDSFEIRSFTCFRQGVEMLLALGLKTTGAPDSPMYTLSPQDFRNNPRLLADFNQQGLDVFPHGHDERQFPTSYAVCKPSGDAEVFGMAADADEKVLELIGVSSIRKAPKEPKAKLRLSGATPQGADSCEPDPPDPGPDLVATPRSLEGMVYYLGQIARVTVLESPSVYGDDCSKPFFVAFLPDESIQRRKCGEGPGFYREQLFRVERGSVTHAVAVASTASGAFSVPPLCPAAGKTAGKTAGKHESAAAEGDLLLGRECSLQYPDHASPQVLTLLNQIWGLHKTQTTAPIIPTINLIAH